MSNTSSDITLPGFGLPLNYKPKNILRNALNKKDLEKERASLRLTTLREFTMLQVMNQITDKPNWHVKVFKASIASKWKKELLADKEIDFTHKMAEWCIAELQYKVAIFKETGAVSVYDADVVKSDTAIPLALKNELKAAIAVLEKVPKSQQDWHPNSDDMVLDLVHPSLFPLVYGRSRILTNGVTTLDDCINQCGNGKIIPVPINNSDTAYSRKFQWLPCEVDISAETGVEIKTYINNLHPHKHANLYAIVEQVIDRAIPLWNMSLTPLLSPALSYNRISFRKVRYVGEEYPEDDKSSPENSSFSMEEISDDEEFDQDISGDEVDKEDLIEDISNNNEDKENSDEDISGDNEDKEESVEDISGDNEDKEEEDDNNSQGEDEDQGVDEYSYDSEPGDDPDDENFNDANKDVILPEPGEFSPPSVPKALEAEYYKRGTKTLKKERSIDLRRDFSTTGLQIIVKFANIHLTPRKPKYEGGTWHVEGQLNEHICATALYYYDCVNTTTSSLAFRQQVRTKDAHKIEHEQDYFRWLEDVFGNENEAPAVQYIGTVDTNQGRLLTFPNILQHQVQPFELANPKRPGHRKILALFLVDPNIRVISTANVPCQQQEWWAEALSTGQEGGLRRLPAELRHQVMKEVKDFPISLDEAKNMRLELMKERSNFVVDQTAAFEGTQFSLCEH